MKSSNWPEWILSIVVGGILIYFVYLLYVIKQVTKTYECRTCHGDGYFYVETADAIKPIQCPDCKGARHFPGVNR